MFLGVVPYDLILQEVGHGLIALPFALLLWKKTKSLKKVGLLFLITYLVDLDHFVDYFSFYGFELNLENFFGTGYFEKTGRAITPFHAWEWIIGLSIMAKKRGWGSIYTILTFALLPHVIFDAIVVGSFLKYSIIYRLFIL